MADQDLDRNEPATPFKLEKARERGQASKSADMVAAIVFAAALVFLASQGWETLHTQFRLDQALLIHAGRVGPGAASLWPLISRVLQETLWLMMPFLATLMLAAVVANLVQTGPILSAEPLTLDFDRLNPVNGLKRAFSMRTLFDAVRACIKLVLLCTVAFLALQSLLPQFHGLAGLSPVGFVRTLLDDMTSLGFKMALILGLVAILDMAFTRHEFAKKMRMSRRELKDEHKNREGDPRIRARLRELRREAVKRSLALRSTRKADLLITNPTHIAVALRYEHGKMESPQLLAKGAGQLAAAMRKIAATHRIPVVENRRLARHIFRELDVDHHVPPSLYADVARIVVWVYAMRAGAARSTP